MVTSWFKADLEAPSLVNNLLGRPGRLGKGKGSLWPLTALGWILQVIYSSSPIGGRDLCAGPLGTFEGSALPRQYGVRPSALVLEGWASVGHQWRTHGLRVGLRAKADALWPCTV